MPEPLFGAAFFVGILGNLLARHVDPTKRAAAEAILKRLSTGSPALPPNHDVERVCRTSLRQSLELMAQTMDLQIAQPKTLIEAFRNRFDSHGKWKPMLGWWHTDEKKWFEEFTAAIASEKALGDFNLRWITNASSLNDPLRSNNNSELEKHFADELLAWTDRQCSNGTAPQFFGDWVRNGWPVTKDSPQARISFFASWCLFLQHHFKDQQKVQAILTADWLASIDSRLTSLSVSSQDISNALHEPLGKQLRILVDVREKVEQLSESYSHLYDRSGQLMALIVEFRNDVGHDFSALRCVLAQTHEVVQQTYDATQQMQKTYQTTENEVIAQGKVIRSSGKKIDLVLRLLEKQLSDARELERPTVRDSFSAMPKLIADSQLLASDGSSRFEKLIGRSQEKGLLTRSWRSGRLRVLSFVAWGGSGKTSLITDWLVDHVRNHWDGVDAFFDWSFYSQGSKDHSNASSDTFLRSALLHFGQKEVADSALLPEVKAEVLAEAMKKQRTLLVLDGLEPLQHSRKLGQVEGRLKDKGISKLLRLLAQAENHVLCVLTTRLPVVDLQPFHDASVLEVSLKHLSVRHGAELLHMAGAKFAGAAEIKNDHQELLAAARDLKGHAMTLQMLGGYLGSVQEGDILRRDRVDFKRVFDDQLEGHTYNVMAAYEEWFQAEGTRGQRQLAVLRMIGLFDRIADATCIESLRKDGGIPGVSDAVAALSEADWQDTLTHLAKHFLVFSNRQTHDLDAHPLLREYFAMQMRQRNPSGFQMAHQRLYEHLCSSTEKKLEPTLDDLQPLYHAVAHGCLAGLYQDCFEKVFFSRILQGTAFYSTDVLGLVNSDLNALRFFTNDSWHSPVSEMKAHSKGWVLNEVGFNLLASLRPNEAVQPMVSALQIAVDELDYVEAARRSGNLFHIHLTNGKIKLARDYASKVIEFASLAKDNSLVAAGKISLATSILYSEELQISEELIGEALQVPRRKELDFTLSYGNVLLHEPELAVWEHELRGVSGVQMSENNRRKLFDKCKNAILHANVHDFSESVGGSLLMQAMDSLIIGRANLFMSIGSQSETKDQYLSWAESYICKAINNLRSAGRSHFLAEGLIVFAWLHVKLNDFKNAKIHLDTAFEMAEVGPMPLYLADVLLHRANLFFDRKPYPWESVKTDLANARKLIDTFGYGRRQKILKVMENLIGGI
jgi:hypothetical protein